MKGLNTNKKKLCLWVLLALVIILLPIAVNGLMIIPCCWSTNEPNEWIGFWGAYLGAIGSFVMALIAYLTMQKNDEQLEYIKKQNRPYVYASIRRITHQKSVPQNNAPQQLYVAHTYYLSLANHGNTLARDITINIRNINPKLNGGQLNSVVSEINRAKLFIPPRSERNFVLHVESYPPGLEKAQIREKKEFFDDFEKSSFDIKVTYSWDFGMDKSEDLLSVKDATTDATTIVQMLDYIDNSIKKLSENIIAIREGAKE